MSEDITLAVEKRDLLGKKIKRLRAAGKIPAVIHDHGKPSIHLSVDELGLKKAYHKAGKNHPVSVKVSGKDYTVLIKEVVYKPATNFIQHTVFQAVKADEKVNAEVPVHLVGETSAEKAGLQLLKKLEHVNVEALPRDLPESFEVDISNLSEAGDRLHVSDLNVPANVEIKDGPSNLIAIVEEPRVHEIEEPETEETEGEEGEAGETPEGEEPTEGEEKSEAGEAKESENKAEEPSDKPDKKE